LAVTGGLILAAATIGCSGGGGSVATYCNDVRTGPNPLDVFAQYNTADPSASHAAVQQGITRLEQLRSAAPGQLRPAFGTLIDVAKDVASALDARASNPTTATVPDFSKRAADIAQASQTVTTYTSSTCGVDLLTAAPPTTTTPTSAPPPASS
jgi:hypothetical protein